MCQSKSMSEISKRDGVESAAHLLTTSEGDDELSARGEMSACLHFKCRRFDTCRTRSKVRHLIFVRVRVTVLELQKEFLFSW